MADAHVRGGDPPDNDMYDPRRAEDPRRQTDRVAPNNADRGLKARGATGGGGNGNGGGGLAAAEAAAAVAELRRWGHVESGVWAQGNTLPLKKKPGRVGAPLGVPAPQPRRSPDLVDPWQGQAAAPPSLPPAGLQGEPGEAWLQGLGGLPSIHGSLLSGPQGAGLGEGRAPSRIAAGTPTPREEDVLDHATRQHHGFPPGRHADWAPPASAAGERGSELGPVRDARSGPHHEVRHPQQDGR
ncbi:unnamed protein product, partial [Polarella glacialis]